MTNNKHFYRGCNQSSRTREFSHFYVCRILWFSLELTWSDPILTILLLTISFISIFIYHFCLFIRQRSWLCIKIMTFSKKNCCLFCLIVGQRETRVFHEKLKLRLKAPQITNILHTSMISEQC